MAKQTKKSTMREKPKRQYRHLETGEVYDFVSASKIKYTITVKHPETGEIKTFDEVDLILLYSTKAVKKKEVINNIIGKDKFYTKLGLTFYRHSTHNPKVGYALAPEQHRVMEVLERMGVLEYNHQTKKVELICEIIEKK